MNACGVHVAVAHQRYECGVSPLTDVQVPATRARASASGGRLAQRVGGWDESARAHPRRWLPSWLTFPKRRGRARPQIAVPLQRRPAPRRLAGARGKGHTRLQERSRGWVGGWVGGWGRTARRCSRSDLLPISMIVMFELECCLASSSHEVRWLKVSRLTTRTWLVSMLTVARNTTLHVGHTW